MSSQRNRANFIRSAMMTEALFGKAVTDTALKKVTDSDLERFSVIYKFIDFVSPQNGNLRINKVTGETPTDYAEEHPKAYAAYARAVERYGVFRDKQREIYRLKEGDLNDRD